MAEEYTFPGPNGVLPEYVKKLLTNWPPSRTGERQVHRHMMKLADRLRHYVPADQAAELIRQNLPRLPKGREIEETVKRAYNIKAIAKADRPPQIEPNIEEIKQIVGERIGPKKALTELEEKSPFPIPGSTVDILYALFGAEDWICIATDFRSSVTRQLKQFVFTGSSELIVPNPMRAAYVIDEKGKRHNRCLANTGPRRFIVCDVDLKGSNFEPLIAHWGKYGVSLRDAAAAIIGYLAEYGPLALVTYSGNVSLQAWFYCQGENEVKGSTLRTFFECAVALGCDPAGWIRCQLFRTPWAIRANTGQRQSVHYFDPETTNLSPDEQEEEDDEDEEGGEEVPVS